MPQYIVLHYEGIEKQMGGEKIVDGDEIGEVITALSQGDSFQVCYDELFETCYTVPEIKGLAVLLLVLEVGFWLFVTYCIIKKRKSP